jgi:PAS domain S-box-containing protein
MEMLPYFLLSVGVSFVGIIVAYRSWTRAETITRVTALNLGGAVIWTLMSALQLTSDNLRVKLFFYDVMLASILVVPSSWLVLAMLVSGYERLVNRSTLVKLSIVPLVTWLLVFTSNYHGLIWSNPTLNTVNPFLPLNINRNLGYWLLIVAYSYALILIAGIMFVRRMVVSRSLFRSQALPLIPTICIPLILNAIFNYNPSLFMNIDATGLMLTAIYVLALWRLNYLYRGDIVPVAHELIIDNMNDSVIVLDWQTRIVDLNPPAQRLIGHTLADALGEPVERMWPEWAMIRKTMDSGAGRIREVSLGFGENSKTYELQSSTIVGLTSKNPNLFLLLRDITERKLMEEKLRLYSEHLEELVAERTKKLRETERLAAIGETASMVAHDLRNPLQGITGATYVLRGESLTVDEKNEMLQLIQSSVEYAEATVRDLLDYSREIHLEQVEVSPKSMSQSALQAVKVPGNVQVQDMSQEQPAISVDPDRMKRVFINLIGNAIDAMPTGGTLTITTKQSNGHLEITISDTGTGIPEKIMKNLWKPMQTTKTKGMGLGLPIVKRIVDAHGGQISVEAKPGEGTTFTIRLPINDANTAQTT